MQELKDFFEKSFEDFHLSKQERKAFDELLADRVLNPSELGALRAKLFDIARNAFDSQQDMKVLEWLERAIKLVSKQQNSTPKSKVYFTPSEDARNAIAAELDNARTSIKACVFTISDNVLANALVAAHKRGVAVQIITDNDKSEDKGSDIEDMGHTGLSIKIDQTANHMHHKFAIIDGKTLITGSYNWTRSAYRYNHENVVISNEIELIRKFEHEFKALWEEFAHF